MLAHAAVAALEVTSASRLVNVGHLVCFKFVNYTKSLLICGSPLQRVIPHLPDDPRRRGDVAFWQLARARNARTLDACSQSFHVVLHGCTIALCGRCRVRSRRSRCARNTGSSQTT